MLTSEEREYYRITEGSWETSYSRPALRDLSTSPNSPPSRPRVGASQLGERAFPFVVDHDMRGDHERALSRAGSR